jgi:FKBP12-rapamycin complex-associated protein
LKFKDHKDPLVRKTTISLIPILAGFNPKAFNLSHLQPCASYMLTVMKKEKGAERSAAFLGVSSDFASLHHASYDFLQLLESCRSIPNRPAFFSL